MQLNATKPEFRKKWKEHLEPKESTQQKAMGKASEGDRHWDSPRKIRMHEKMQFIACNVRDMNTLGKRQELAEQRERDQIDVAMISETQKNKA